MDAFQPGPGQELAFRQCLGRFATGVTVVTAMGPEGPLGMTANSFASLSLDPPLVLWSPAKRSNRHQVFSTAQRFAIHILAEDQRAVAQQFSRRGDDFNGLDWTECADGLPALPGVLARLVCAQEATHEGGDHTIVIGRVLSACQREGAPLAFLNGRYGRLSPFE